jgi:hypothetical protein
VESNEPAFDSTLGDQEVPRAAGDTVKPLQIFERPPTLVIAIANAIGNLLC